MSYYCNTQGYTPPPLQASELYFMTSFSLITNLYSYNERLLLCTPQTYNYFVPGFWGRDWSWQFHFITTNKHNFIEEQLFIFNRVYVKFLVLWFEQIDSYCQFIYDNNLVSTN